MRLLVAAAGLIVLLWVLYQLVDALLLTFFALVFAIAIAAPVTWLERHGWRRWLAGLLVFAVLAGLCSLLGWLIVPRIGEQLVDFAHNLPQYAERASHNVSSWLHSAPNLAASLRAHGDLVAQAAPSISAFATRVGAWSISLLTAIVLLLVVVALVIYIVFDPRSLLRGYLRLLPGDYREPCARALARFSAMVVEWIRANLIVGLIEAGVAAIVLSLLGIPASFVWAAFTFFAEFIPKLGPYLMALPPTIVAFSVSPLTAVWVVVFYIIMNEVMGDVVVPLVRGRSMALHPALLVFATAAMGLGFGLLGALVATPLTAFVTAFVQELVIARRNLDEAEIDETVEAILDRDPDRCSGGT